MMELSRLWYCKWNFRNQKEVDQFVSSSQWTTMLDKYGRSYLHLMMHSLIKFCRIEDALDAAGIRYERLDGTMKRDDRTKAMDALKYDPACEILLVSLKAGGVGLNLTAAQRVYLMDPYWYVFCTFAGGMLKCETGTRP